jgi:hypothetical protein
MSNTAIADRRGTAIMLTGDVMTLAKGEGTFLNAKSEHRRETFSAVPALSSSH